jgi:pimeloyl-ACP methyl ester carboxylesterase
MSLPATPLLNFVTCASPAGLHRIAYWEWPAKSGVERAPAVVCVHGLTRNGRDFDVLAEALASDYRVICPDMAGRGQSDRLGQSALYAIPQYLADCVTLIARLDVERVAWVGTSMGGLIGMSLAALPKNPVACLVLNDVGPELSAEGLGRIADYVGKAPEFDSYEECVDYTRTIAAGFGPHDSAGWDLLCRHYWVRSGARWHVHYDPRIAEPFALTRNAGPMNLWPLYEAIGCPTLLLRGEQSDLLGSKIAAEMGRRGPKARIVEFAGVGHAPSLIPTEQIESVQSFLKEKFV